MKALRVLGPRLLFVGLALGAGVLAWRSGGGADDPAPPPRPEAIAQVASALAGDGGATASAPARAAAAGAAGPEGYEAAIRLVEIAKDARVDAPARESALRALSLHWRKMKPPFVTLGGEAKPFVTSVALRTSATETQWAMPTGAGKNWAPDARIWNMNEGSFDQREALTSAAPGSFTFKVTVPMGARLSFSEGTLNATRDTTVFVVTVVDQKGATHEVHRHRLAPAYARRWTEQSADLSAFAGQTVELRLSVEATAATPEERKVHGDRGAQPGPLPRATRPRATGGAADGGAAAPLGAAAGGADAGAPDALAFPGPPVALWGNPTILARARTRAPLNVLWIVVDALRPDVLASFHDDADDAAKQAAPYPPLDALLPKIPGLTPEIDALAKKGVRFTRAYSGGSWTRPGTLSMLSGARSSELGIDTERWVLRPEAVQRFYASEPPLLPLLLRRQGVVTRAFVNNYFMVGYAPVGVEMGFERTDDHRYRTRDTLEVTQDATRWIEENKEQRFFLFVNYNSPHEPYEPPDQFLERVPPPPAGPKDKIARLYMAEAAKDDEAIGVLVKTLEKTGLSERTIIVVTADHGETLSAAHGGTSGLDKMPIRYHHAVSNFEETTRVPILVVAPGLLPADVEVKARVRNVDLAPTVLDLLGLELHPKMTGKSLVPLAKGQKEADERVVVSEGRGTRGIIHGRWRLLTREGAARTTILADKSVTVSEELYDLETDPGERHDLAPSKPDVVAEMRARLTAALKNAPVAGSTSAVASAAEASAQAPVLHLRWVGAGQARRVSGTILVGDARTRAKSIDVQPVDVGREAFKVTDGKIDVALVTSPSSSVGLDLVVDPPGTAITWDLYLDDKAWPDELVFGGPYGLLTPVLRKGMVSDEARLAAQSPLLPPVDPRRDAGFFVVRERRGEAPAEAHDDEGAEEMARLLREWGYAHGSGGSK